MDVNEDSLETPSAMSPARQIVIIFIAVLFSAGINNVQAQLRRYLNDSPAKERAVEKELEKEAYSVITKKTVAYGDTLSYSEMTYAIQSFDGANDKITIFERPFNHTLYIECPGDSLKIEDLYSLVKVHFLRPDLLEIVYSPRGGSDQGYEDVLILGIDNGKINVAMAILTVNEYDMPGEYGLYQVRLKLQGQTLRDCQLAVTIREILKSNADRSKDFDHSSSFALKFDEKRRIFYNQLQHLNKVFGMSDSSAGSDRLLSGDYPVINLGKYAYYYIDDAWYERDKDAIGRKNSMSIIGPKRSFIIP